MLFPPSEWARIPRNSSGGERSSSRTPSAEIFHCLFLLNLGLQIWDGLATYYGMQLGIPEGNPLVRVWVEGWGVGWALVSAKTTACGLLLFLRCLGDLFLSRCAMTLTAGVYFLFSFLPWFVLLFLQ
jgi:Domain of unknown function (DUF5658)